jgi:hypothetical protein
VEIDKLDRANQRLGRTGGGSTSTVGTPVQPPSTASSEAFTPAASTSPPMRLSAIVKQNPN